MDFYTKYLKYKKKYLQLKKQLGGGKAILGVSNKINLFSDPEMEQLLNPIYGLILCENGYLSNNYFLYKSNVIQTELGKIINNVCNHIEGRFQPTNNILFKLQPIDFGRYIANKYINMKNKIIDKIT